MCRSEIDFSTATERRGYSANRNGSRSRQKAQNSGQSIPINATIVRIETIISHELAGYGAER
jgi:hypothetical protein